MARRSTEAMAGAKKDFLALIAESAYYKAEKRGFEPGHELEDWLAAEVEIAALNRAAKSATTVAKATASVPKKPATRRKTATVKKLK